MISIRRVVKISLKWNVFSMLCLFLLIAVTVQVKSHQICSDCPPLSSTRTYCDTSGTSHDHSEGPTAEYSANSWACAGFTEAQAGVDVSISDVGYFRGTPGRYGGYASGQAGNKDPVIDKPIGVEIYRPTSRGVTIGIVARGTGGTVGITVSGGQLSTREPKNFYTSDWRIPTSHNNAWCQARVWDWNGELSVPSRNADYNGSVNLTTAGNGNTWIAATALIDLRARGESVPTDATAFLPESLHPWISLVRCCQKCVFPFS